MFLLRTLRFRAGVIARLRGVLLLLFSASLLPGCAEAEGYDLRIREASLTVEIADTPELRSRGLMFRESLGESEGMLFVFDEDARRSFWMKDTLIPLSIAYIRSDWVILEIYDMEPLSLEAIPSRNPVRYALEVNQGFFDEQGIEAGTRVYPSDALLRRLAERP